MLFGMSQTYRSCGGDNGRHSRGTAKCVTKRQLRPLLVFGAVDVFLSVAEADYLKRRRCPHDPVRRDIMDGNRDWRIRDGSDNYAPRRFDPMGPFRWLDRFRFACRPSRHRPGWYAGSTGTTLRRIHTISSGHRRKSRVSLHCRSDGNTCPSIRRRFVKSTSPD